MTTNDNSHASSAAPRLIFACSGGADVGEVADQAARAMTRAGVGRMYCLSGIGGRVSSILDTTADAAAVLVINGCAKTCATHVLEAAGFRGFAHLCLNDLGFKKGQTAVSDEHIQAVVDAGSALLAAATCETNG